MNFISSYNLSGIFIGFSTFAIIGLFHPIVIKAEYYLGSKYWWIFLLMGIAGIFSSILIDHILASALLGVFGFSSLWSILEMFHQEKRVKKGWFPENPKRRKIMD